MATLQKRNTRAGKVRWRAVVRVQGVPAQSKTFASHKAAEKWAAKIEDDIKTGSYTEAWEANRRTVTEACRRWVRERLRDPDITMPKGRQAQLDWWKQRLGSTTLARLTPAGIRSQAAKLTCSGPTKNRYLAALSAVLEATRRDWGWMRGENPVHLVRKWPEHPGRLRVLAGDELKRLLVACRNEDKLGRLFDLVILAIATGARQGELLALQLRDLRLDEKEPYALVEARELGARKTGARRRLELVGEAVHVAKRRAAERREFAAKRKHPRREELYLFGTNRRGRPSFPAKDFRAALAKAGIEDFHFHDLRHCAASFAAMSGASLRDLMDLLGHRTAAMSKRYSHLVRSHTRKLTARMTKKHLPHVGDSPESQTA